MLAVVGSDAPFAQGREQLELLAGLQVSTKSVERQAEQIGPREKRRWRVRAPREPVSF